MDEIVELTGAEAWTFAHNFGLLLGQRFPNQEVDELVLAFEYNTCQLSFDDLKAAESIVCTYKGCNDGTDWKWTIVTGGQTWHIVAGCDYTGWDCQSWLTATVLP